MAVQGVMTRYAAAVDTRDFTAFEALFTEGER
jgi:3-phenylpropionate/cinnamic acid dioxygenase small subunit